jgi:hypothetical protein
MVFSGRPAGWPVFAPLHERAAQPPGGLSPARGPRLAATQSGLVGPGQISAPRARGAAAGGPSDALPRCAARAPPLRFPGLCSRALLLFEQSSASSVVRVGPMGPLRRPSAVLMPSPLGDERRTCRRVPPPGAPLGWPVAVGTEGGRVLPSPFVYRGAALVAHSYHPSCDKQESTNEASSPDSLCASVARPRETSLG